MEVIVKVLDLRLHAFHVPLKSRYVDAVGLRALGVVLHGERDVVLKKDRQWSQQIRDEVASLVLTYC